MIISRAAEADLHDILQLRLEAANWLIGKGIQQWNPQSMTAQKVQDNYENAELFIAKCNGWPVGSYSIQWSDAMIWKGRDQGDAGYIHKLVTNRECKGSDIGRQLLASAELYIQQKGKRLSRLDCMADNIRLNQFYVDAGYAFVTRLDAASWSASLYEKPLT
jgi:GNAT superfamily N-acetyltransferase